MSLLKNLVYSYITIIFWYHFQNNLLLWSSNNNVPMTKAALLLYFCLEKEETIMARYQTTIATNILKMLASLGMQNGQDVKMKKRKRF